MALLPLLLAAPAARAGDYAVGFENFLYRSTSSLLNRDNIFGLDPTENLMRLSGSGRTSFSKLTLKASAFVERQTGRTDKTRVRFREAFAEYKSDDGFLLRAGKQKTAWGSGLVWNPTARLEPPKSPANPGIERPGVDAIRMDVSPSDWASLTLVAARAQANLADLPGSLSREGGRQWTGAVRARLLVRNTDIALTYLGGTGRDGLLGLDLGRTWGAVALHAESALYRGSEIDTQRPLELFARSAVGALWTPGDTTVSVEYFFNGEGFSGSEFQAYTNRLDRNLTLANNQALPPPVRAAALAAWGQDAAIPFSPNLGLRRHYASLGLSHDVTRDLTGSFRLVTGLSDRSVIATPGLAYAPGPHLQMNLDLLLLFGPVQAEYKLAPFKRAIQARMKYFF